MVGTVAVLMLAWVLGAAPLALPLLAAFSPALLVPGFLAPFAATFATQALLRNFVATAELMFKVKVLAAVCKDGLKLRRTWYWSRKDKGVVLAAVKPDLDTGARTYPLANLPVLGEQHSVQQPKCTHVRNFFICRAALHVDERGTSTWGGERGRE